jgi:hypothetical protein
MEYFLMAGLLWQVYRWRMFISCFNSNLVSTVRQTRKQALSMKMKIILWPGVNNNVIPIRIIFKLTLPVNPNWASSINYY